MDKEFYFSIEDFLTRLDIDPTKYECPFTAQVWTSDEELEKYGRPVLVVKVDLIRPLESTAKRDNNA